MTIFVGEFVVADGGFVNNVGTRDGVNGTDPLAVFWLMTLGAELSGGDVFVVEQFSICGLHVAWRERIIAPRHGVEGNICADGLTRALRFGQNKNGGKKRKGGDDSAYQ